MPGTVAAALLVVALLSPQVTRSWATFASRDWGLAIDYPIGWSADDNGEQVTFRSPGGVAIVLRHAAADTPSEPPPGRRSSSPACTIKTTLHGVTATVCVDAASQVRRAVLVLNAQVGASDRVTLSARGADPEVFDAMVASVRATSREP
jgi:predicted Zn-dependent protease